MTLVPKKPEKKLSLSTVEEGGTNGAAADARAEKNTTGQGILCLCAVTFWSREMGNEQN